MVSLYLPAIYLSGRGVLKSIRDNVGIGKDDTLFALADGTVKFGRLGKDKKQVSIVNA